MKTSKILSAFAILAIVSVGCHNDDTPSVKTAEITANVSGQAIYPGGEALEFNWNEGSTIALVNESVTVLYEMEKGVDGGASAKFRGEDLAGTAKYAGSPFSGESSMDGETFNFDFPSVQYVDGAINSTEYVDPNDVKVLVAGRTANGQTFDFKNVAAFIRIPVISKENCSVDSVEVVACGGAKLSGRSVVVWEDGTPSITVDRSAGRTSSRVIFSSPFIAGSEPVYVTVPVAPGDYSSGLRITVFTKIANSKISYDYDAVETGKVYETEPILCGNSFAILIDGPTFNKSVKEYVAGITGEQEAELDTNEVFIQKFRFKVNAEMPSSTEGYLDLSQMQDGTILAQFDQEEGNFDIFTASACMAVVSGSNMFHGFKGLQEIEGLDCLDTYGATAMKHMFSQSNVRKLDLSAFNNANAAGLDSMFWRCWNLEELVLSDNFVTAKALRAVALFHSCISLKSVDVSKFDLSNCASIGQMYQNCWSMESIDCPLDASACTSVAQMFYNCRRTKYIDLSKFKTSEKLVSTRYMFYCDTAVRGTLNMSNMYTLKDTSFFYALAGIGKVDSIIFGPDFKLDAALKRAESKSSPLQYFFGYTATPTSTTCYVGAAREDGNPTVVVSSRLFLQQLMKNTMTGPKIQMKTGKIKYVNYNGNQYLLKDKDGNAIDIKDINTSVTTYVVVDPDEQSAN